MRSGGEDGGGNWKKAGFIRRNNTAEGSENANYVKRLIWQ